MGCEPRSVATAAIGTGEGRCFYLSGMDQSTPVRCRLRIKPLSGFDGAESTKPIWGAPRSHSIAKFREATR